jgi:hypothetical protein
MDDIILRINNYLQNGGLFNPELMEHDKVSLLIQDAHKEITALKAQLASAKEVIEFYGGLDIVTTVSSDYGPSSWRAKEWLDSLKGDK